MVAKKRKENVNEKKRKKRREEKPFQLQETIECYNEFIKTEKKNILYF